MRYKSFRIRNFKGIKDTTVHLDNLTNTNVFACVGLNESGKTTVLEAIHSFSPDKATAELLGSEAGIPASHTVPRHLISEFTGNVSVEATVSVSESDKRRILLRLKYKDIFLKSDDVPNEVIFEKSYAFNNGDYISENFELKQQFEVKSKRAKLWRVPSTEQKKLIMNIFYGYTPDIAYFPTFIFDFPSHIYLTDRGSKTDKFYRKVFQDILDFDGRGHKIQKDIVNRVRKDSHVKPWLSFLTDWRDNDDRDKIQHIMDRAGAAVTQLVFGKWNEIFGEDVRGKEIVISSDVEEGEVKDENGNPVKTEEHDVYIKFQIRDGTRRFNVNDRSLGFRWFFSFMLFTQFRAARTTLNFRPTLFLFDEPAANLHAAAQQKLIDSFPEIAQNDHVLVYSTHSHYMIEPKWLEQTFIVTNRADAPMVSMVDEISLDDESLDVQVATYREFVNAQPQKTSYFQPILDRLDVVPSKFDIQKKSIILEGKSDYYILRYGQKLTGKKELPLIPGLGAGTFGALVALQVGWGLECLFLLDGDKQGKYEKDRYSTKFGINQNSLLTLDEIDAHFKCIEDILDVEALETIKSKIGIAKKPSKKQILQYFQESLASDKTISLGKGFDINMKLILEALESKLTNH